MTYPTLLPTGIYDYLAPEAAKHRDAGATLINAFESFGYQYVSPPIVEFEETALKESATALASETFRLMDPDSKQMLAIRSDITTQIARIATSRLERCEAPVRLCYMGDVLRVGSSAINRERQLTQAGVELIGTSSLMADIEVIRVVVNALSALNIDQLTIDFSIPKLKAYILDDMELDYDARRQLDDAIARKDPKIIHAYGGKHAAMLEALCAPVITLESLLTLKLPKQATPLTAQLKELIALVELNFPQLNITIDPLEARHGGYHTGIAFALFARHAVGEIARGGRYQINSNAQDSNAASNVDAVGCSLYVNMLTDLLPKNTCASRVFLPFGTDETEATHLRKRGLITIYATDKCDDNQKEATRLGCDQLFHNGNVIDV